MKFVIIFSLWRKYLTTISLLATSLDSYFGLFRKLAFVERTKVETDTLKMFLRQFSWSNICRCLWLLRKRFCIARVPALPWNTSDSKYSFDLLCVPSWTKNDKWLPWFKHQNFASAARFKSRWHRFIVLCSINTRKQSDSLLRQLTGEEKHIASFLDQFLLFLQCAVSVMQIVSKNFIKKAFKKNFILNGGIHVLCTIKCTKCSTLSYLSKFAFWLTRCTRPWISRKSLNKIK